MAVKNPPCPKCGRPLMLISDTADVRSYSCDSQCGYEVDVPLRERVVSRLSDEGRMLAATGADGPDSAGAPTPAAPRPRLAGATLRLNAPAYDPSKEARQYHIREIGDLAQVPLDRIGHCFADLVAALAQIKTMAALTGADPEPITVWTWCDDGRDRYTVRRDA